MPELLVEPKEKVEVNTGVNIEESEEKSLGRIQPEPGANNNESTENPTLHLEPGKVKDENDPADKPVTDAKSSQPVFGESLPGLESPKHSNPESREEPPSKLETEKDVINLKDDSTNTKFKDSVDELTNNYLEPKPFEVVSLAQQFIQVLTTSNLIIIITLKGG